MTPCTPVPARCPTDVRGHRRTQRNQNARCGRGSCHGESRCTRAPTPSRSSARCSGRPHHWYRPDPATFGPRRGEGFDETTQQLTEYLAGEHRQFTLPLNPSGDTFQMAVWGLIAQVPYGDTTTYGELAAQIGGGFTAQQVGAAVGRNPLSIVVPCHRVVGRNGKLTGYAGGLARKRYLLDLERDHISRSDGIPFQDVLIDDRG